MNTWMEEESVFLWVGSVEDNGKGQVQEICLRVVYFCFNKMLKRIKPRVAKAQTWERAILLGFHQACSFRYTCVLAILSPIKDCRSWMYPSGSLHQVFLWLRTLVAHMTPKKNSVSALEVEIWGYIIWKSCFPILSSIMLAIVEYILAQYCILRNK